MMDLWRRFRPADKGEEPTFPRPPCVPPGMVVTAIGDVHGRLDLLEPLLAGIEASAAARPDQHHVAVLLGDMIDRGPDTAGVLDRLGWGVRGAELVLLKGNHEELFGRFLDGDPAGQGWLEVGGIDTLRSYGIPLGSLREPGGLEAVRLQVPPEHFELLAGLRLSYTCGDYFFVHAGARPGVPLDRQDEHDLLWIRSEFHKDRTGFDKKIVHGHTPVPEPELLDTRINLDTGACWTGRLTAARFEDARVTLLG